MEKLFISGYTSRLGVEIKLPTPKVLILKASAWFTHKSKEVSHG